MSNCYILSQSSGTTSQSSEDHCFLGGVPRLPVDKEIPRCNLCSAEQTFFFQVALPHDQKWPSTTVAAFACTSCVDEDFLIPEMLMGRLRGIDIPTNFLIDYQRNFRFLVFDTAHAALRSSYAEKIGFRRIKIEASDDPAVPRSKIGGIPNWLLEDETPGSYAGRVPMFFLMQLQAGFRFETVEGAPRQIELGLDGKPRPSSRPHYELFNGNAIYFFGTYDSDIRLIYAVTQID